MNNTFILNRQIPDLNAHHKQLKSMFEYFNGFNVEDSVITVELTIEATQEIQDAINAVEPPNPPIPNVTPRQIRQALIISGVDLNTIEAAIDSMPEPQRSLARTEWEYSTAFERNRPLVAQVGQLLGWTDTQLDTLWVMAGTL